MTAVTRLAYKEKQRKLTMHSMLLSRHQNEEGKNRDIKIANSSLEYVA
jgi:hypothetical protein